MGDSRRVGGPGVNMTRREWLQQALDRANRGLDQLGQRLLALYESAARFSGGLIPFRPVKPRILAGTAVVVACLLAIVLLNGSFYAGRGLIRHFLSEPAMDPSTPTEYVLRCTTCGGDQRIGRDQLDRVDSADGLYWCENCRAYSAYRVRIGDACIAMPFHDGEAP